MQHGGGRHASDLVIESFRRNVQVSPQQMVPKSGLMVNCLKVFTSLSRVNTPPARTCRAKSTSPEVPSAKVTARR